METLEGTSLEERDHYYANLLCKRSCSDKEARELSRVRWLMEEAKKQRFTNFLDIACHDGFVTRWMVDEPEFEFLLGVDPCGDAIRNAMKSVLSRRNAHKASYLCMPYQKLRKFCDHEVLFSGVSAFEFIEHLTVPEGEQLITAMYLRLKLGGRGYICTPNKPGRWGDSNPDKHHITLYTKESLEYSIDRVVRSPLNWFEHEPKCDHLMCSWTKT